MSLLVQHGVWIVFVATFAARVGAPLPAAPLLVVAGGLAVAGELALGAVSVASLIANLLGDAVWFVAGRRWGYRVLGLLCRVSMSPDTCVRQSESLILRWGGWSLVAAKFVPGVSVIAPPMAGALRMSWVRFVAWDLIAAAAWTATFVVLGMVFSTQIELVLRWIANAGVSGSVAVIAAVAALLAVRHVRRKRSESSGRG